MSHNNNKNNDYQDNITLAQSLNRSLLESIQNIIKYAHLEEESKTVNKHNNAKRENLLGKASLASAIAEIIDTEIKIEKFRPSAPPPEILDPDAIEVAQAFLQLEFKP